MYKQSIKTDASLALNGKIENLLMKRGTVSLPLAGSRNNFENVRVGKSESLNCNAPVLLINHYPKINTTSIFVPRCASEYGHASFEQTIHLKSRKERMK